MATTDHREQGCLSGYPLHADGRDSAVSGVVLAGGRSHRLGQDKALIKLGTSQSLIARVVERLSPLVAEVVVVADGAERFGEISAWSAPDLYPGVGTLGGIYSGLIAAREEYVFVVGCDMPFLNEKLISYLLSLPRDYDLLLPRHGGRLLEPLHAIYSRGCREAIRRNLDAGRYSATGYLDQVRVRYVEEAELIRFDPDLLSFFNINTPGDLRRAVGLLAT